MSKIRRSEQIIKEVVVQVRCDNCGKLAAPADPPGWRTFSVEHSDWGNDSVDSYDQFGVCSASCWLVLVRKIVNEYVASWRKRPELWWAELKGQVRP